MVIISMSLEKKSQKSEYDIEKFLMKKLPDVYERTIKKDIRKFNWRLKAVDHNRPLKFL